MTKRKYTSMATMVMMLALAIILVACGGDKTAAVSKIEVTKAPTKEVYLIGETFSAAGGEITVTFDNDKTEIKPLTDSEVTLSAVNTDRPGRKTVTVTFGGKRANFSVTVEEEKLGVTFNLNYDGAPSPTVKEVIKGAKLSKPTDPIRTGYYLERWYKDQDLTSPYNFDTEVVNNAFTLYANWRKEGVEYFDVTFDVGYYGAVKTDTVTLNVEEGQKVSKPSTNPIRYGYEFLGWFTTENGSTAFDFNTIISEKTTIYAKWNRTLLGNQSFVFEAEDTDLTGKTGPGFSGTASEESMIQKLGDTSYVSFLYQQGLSLEFFIASDSDVENVVFKISLAAEMASMSIDPNNYKITVNGVDVSYSKIDFIIPEDKGGAGYVLPFAEFTLSSSISLKKGANEIKLTTNNSVNFVGSGTIAATAPVVDYIKLETDAILIWDGVKGLPKKYNV